MPEKQRVKHAICGLAIGALFIQSSAQAVDWTGTNGSWNTVSVAGSSGWLGAVPDAIDAVATISTISSVTGAVSVNGTYTVGTIIAGGNYNNRILGPSSGNLTFDVSSGNALLDLTNGGLTTNHGISASVAMTLNDLLEVRSRVGTSSATANLTGVISGTGGLSITNVEVPPAGGGFRVVLNNTLNTFSGGITLSQGVGLRVGGSNAMGIGAVTLPSSASFAASSLDFRADIGSATQVHSNNIDFGTNTTGGSSVLSAQAGMNITLNGVLSGKMGNTGRTSLNNSTLTLGGTSPNTWTEILRLDSGGTVIADKVGAINNGVSVRNGTAGQTTSILVGVSDTITGQISFDGNGSGIGFAYQGRLGLKDGNNGTATFVNASKINLVNTWGVGGTGLAPTNSLNLHSGNGTGTLAIGTEIGTNPFEPRNINVTGTGTVLLSRAGGNTYGGTTTVSGGTLLVTNVSGSGTSTGAVTVASGGTLGGTGIIATTNANVTVVGKLSPGVNGGGEFKFNLGTGSLDVSGAVVSTNSQSFVFGLDSLLGTSDKVALTNATTTLSIGSNVLEFDDFAFSNLGGLETGSYTLFDTGSAILGSLGSNLTGSIGSATATLAFANGNQDIVLSVVAGPATSSWAVDANGTWSTASNWSPATAPNGVGASATFGPVITAKRTVTVDAPQTVGTLTFNSANTYSVDGAASLTLDNGTSAPTAVNVTTGSHQISAPLTIARDLSVDVAGAAGLVLTDVQDTTFGLTKVGTGSVSVNRFRGSSISVEGGTLKVIAGGGNAATSVVSDVSIAAGASLDLADAALVVDHSGAFSAASVRQAILDGRLITSFETTSRTLGYADNAVLGKVLFGGVNVDATSVLIAFALRGDADLNGRVEFADLVALAQNYNTSGKVWTSGDTNYDGNVNFADLVSLAQNYNQSLNAAQQALLGGDFAADFALAQSVVPEPALFGLLALLAPLTCRRRV